ncbi:hypothetical protein [Achromobacter ruhlandii]|uniref:hypothetical protein n=1 Tax=Achromobacter ruhlandii TaxID=72557 RepID=UPI003B9F4E7B
MNLYTAPLFGLSSASREHISKFVGRTTAMFAMALGGAAAADSLPVTFAYAAPAHASSAATPAPRSAGPTTLQVERKLGAPMVTYADQRTTPYSKIWCGTTAGPNRSVAANEVTGLEVKLGYAGQSDQDLYVDVDITLSELERLNLLEADGCYMEAAEVSSTQLRSRHGLPLSGNVVTIPLANGGIFMLRVDRAAER